MFARHAGVEFIKHGGTDGIRHPAQVEGGLIYGLSSVMGEAITTENGAVVQGNFDRYPLLRFARAPRANVEFVRSEERPSGLGEQKTPPAHAAPDSVGQSCG